MRESGALMQNNYDDYVAAKRWRILLQRLALPADATVNEVIETITVGTLAQLKGEVDAWITQAHAQGLGVTA